MQRSQSAFASNRILLDGDHTTMAGRLAGALRAVDRVELADNVLKTMRSVSTTSRLTATHIRYDTHIDRRTNFVSAGAIREPAGKPEFNDRCADRRINSPADWE